MHVDNCPAKSAGNMEVLVSSTTLNATSILEEDLALSSSTVGTIDKSPSVDSHKRRVDYEPAKNIIYVNEDAMDCHYDESSDTYKTTSPALPEPYSPEMFETDPEEEDNNVDDDPSNLEKSRNPISSPSPSKLGRAKLLAEFDYRLLARIHKHLSGVPPPPKHTICQNDCQDFLRRIYQNRHLFWASPFESDKLSYTRDTLNKSSTTADINACDVTKNETARGTESFLGDNAESSHSNSSFLKNDDETESTISSNLKIVRSDCSSSNVAAESSLLPLMSNTNENKLEKGSPFLRGTIARKEVDSQWPGAYFHKYHGIYYNRNRAVEDFENLTTKLCERYVGAETQSSCNIWFAKQAPGSARKRQLLAKRNIGQSPGKRLSHLAKRRRMFSSANLQGLGLADKKQLMLNVKKPIARRGKSPRNSAKKRVACRLSIDGSSPRKSKLETSRRALFQSPPTDRPGPSKAPLVSGTIDTRKIKRALFPTPKKREDTVAEATKRVTFGETRKRKSEEELEEGPRLKWAKSLSFDCPRDLENDSINSWDHERHSTGSVLSKGDVVAWQGKSELSETHRKKLLWAVAEALRGKGIGMGHPRFKQFAGDLARKVKKFMPDLANKNIPRKPGSTSDRMLKLAKHHVLFVTDVKLYES